MYTRDSSHISRMTFCVLKKKLVFNNETVVQQALYLLIRVMNDVVITSNGM